jgi:hypothetical protein
MMPSTHHCCRATPSRWGDGDHGLVKSCGCHSTIYRNWSHAKGGLQGGFHLQHVT